MDGGFFPKAPVGVANPQSPAVTQKPDPVEQAVEKIPRLFGEKSLRQQKVALPPYWNFA